MLSMRADLESLGFAGVPTVSKDVFVLSPETLQLQRPLSLRLHMPRVCVLQLPLHLTTHKPRHVHI